MVRSFPWRPALLAGAAALALMGPAVTAVAQTKPATPAPAAAPAIAASHLAAAAEYVELSRMGRSFNYVVPQFSERIKQMFGTTRPEIAADLDSMLKTLQPEFEAQKADMLATTYRIVAQAMSEADLKDVIAFLKTPAGARYVEAQPRIIDTLFGEMELWSRRLSEYMLVRVRTELKKKNIDL